MFFLLSIKTKKTINHIIYKHCNTINCDYIKTYY